MPRLTKYDKKMIEFNKRYDKFKKYNLPAPFWDEERQTFEYVLFESDPWRENQLVVTPNLYNAFENIIWDNFDVEEWQRFDIPAFQVGRNRPRRVFVRNMFFQKFILSFIKKRFVPKYTVNFLIFKFYVVNGVSHKKY